jgi:hypothetical protein
MRWRLYLEEYGPKFHYVKGEKNVLADAFSRLPTTHSELLLNRLNPPKETEDHFFSILDDPELEECFLNYPTQFENPLNLHDVQYEQTIDKQLMELTQLEPQFYSYQQIDGHRLICFQESPVHPWRIVLPNALLDDTIHWYHQFLNHLGMTRVHDTIASTYWHPQLRNRIEQIVSTCDTCQRFKLPGPGYGILPPREAAIAPWEEVCIDLIGPWEVQIGSEKIEFNALTCIDPVTNLTELIQVRNKTCGHVTSKFEQVWLSRYPKPSRCVHDNGGEFIGFEFDRLMRRLSIENHPINALNPQANSICERMHQTVGNILRTLVHVHRPKDYNEATELVDDALATASHTLRAASHSTLKATPGAVAFGRNMLFNIPFQADLYALQQKRQLRIDDNLLRANNKRRSHDYQPGEKVLMIDEQADKLDAKFIGPYPITKIHTNGNVTLRIKPNVLRRINIRRIKPYKS